MFELRHNLTAYDAMYVALAETLRYSSDILPGLTSARREILGPWPDHAIVTGVLRK